MKKFRALALALTATAVLATPAIAAKGTTSIAPQALSTDAPAPADFDPAQKAAVSASNQEKMNAIGIEANPIIVLDPGHGGTDPGAVGNGLQEKVMNLDIATRSKNYMAANYPATIYMTRTTDTTVSLSSRTTYANNVGASFFVSFHCNSYSTSTPNGLETYYYPGASDGQSLATNIYNKLAPSFSTLRGVKSADFYVLHYTYMAAALGETGFISNPTDASKLASSTFRQTLAQQYAAGMHVYWWGY
jgi:N-acetylmuramoyl-L-alanine amidase